MKTLQIRVDLYPKDLAVLRPAADRLRDGGVVAYPTECGYVLAASPGSAAALGRLRGILGLAADRPLTLHLADPAGADRPARAPIPQIARRLMARFWPGPLTILLPAREGGGTVGLRIPDPAAARELIRLVGGPVSAATGKIENRKSKIETPRAMGDAGEVLAAFDGKIDAIVDAGTVQSPRPATVVRVDDGKPVVVREGAIPRGLIEECDYKDILFVCTGNSCRSPMAEALFRKLVAAKLHTGPEALEGRGWRIHSAGTSGGVGGATPEAVEAVADLGAGLRGHRSRSLSFGMIEDADAIYVMSPHHRKSILEMAPEAEGKVLLLDPDGGTIEDPIGGDRDLYAKTARRIQACLEQVLKRLA